MPATLKLSSGLDPLRAIFPDISTTLTDASADAFDAVTTLIMTMASDGPARGVPTLTSTSYTEVFTVGSTGPASVLSVTGTGFKGAESEGLTYFDTSNGTFNIKTMSLKYYEASLDGVPQGSAYAQLAFAGDVNVSKHNLTKLTISSITSAGPNGMGFTLGGPITLVDGKVQSSATASLSVSLDANVAAGSPQLLTVTAQGKIQTIRGEPNFILNSLVITDETTGQQFKLSGVSTNLSTLESGDTAEALLNQLLGSNATVTSGGSFSLSSYSACKDLVLSGTDNIDGTGNSAKNTLTGNDGNNVLDGAGGVDALKGGKGDDAYLIDLTQTTASGYGIKLALEDKVTESTASGSDTIRLRTGALSGGGYETVSVSKASELVLTSNIEHLDATMTGSTILNLKGNDLANGIVGNAGNNQLTGMAGNDSLNGGAGADTLIGGAGVDSLTGGDGADRFLFDTTPSSTNYDTVADFASGTDILALSVKAFAKLKGLTNFTDNFRSGAGIAAADTNDYLLFDTQTSTLYYDADGTGTTAAKAVAVLTGVTVVAATDFALA